MSVAVASLAETHARSNPSNLVDIVQDSRVVAEIDGRTGPWLCAVVVLVQVAENGRRVAAWRGRFMRLFVGLACVQLLAWTWRLARFESAAVSVAVASVAETRFPTSNLWRR